jgi:U3 small nucleolar RNA-associated protein 14
MDLLDEGVQNDSDFEQEDEAQETHEGDVMEGNDDDEQEEEETDDSDEDLENEDGLFFDLSDMLDSKPASAIPEKSSGVPASKSSLKQNDDLSRMLLPRSHVAFEDMEDEDVNEDEFGSDEEDDENSEIEEDEEDDEDNDGKKATKNQSTDLAYYITSLDKSAHLKRKRKLPELMESLGESEYNLTVHPTSASSPPTPNNKNPALLDMSDLVASIAGHPELSGLRKQVHEFDRLAEDSKSGAGTGQGAEAVPLPKRTTDRMQRVAAYDEARKEVTKWMPMVKNNRMADQLVFGRDEEDRPSGVSSSAIVSKFEVSFFFGLVWLRWVS